MFYQDDLQIQIIDVFHIHRKKSNYCTPKRPFHVLSKRICGECDMSFATQSFRVTPDYLLYIPENTEYERQSYADEEMVAIHFNILNKVLSEPFLLPVDNLKGSSVFLEISEVWSRKERGYKYKCHALLLSYLSEILLPRRVSKEYEKIEPSVLYIKNNPAQKIQVEELSKMCGLCLTQYRKLFKKALGCTPVQYINRLRVRLAISKMSGGYHSMVEIAELCGFSDQNYFNRVFKAETGQTPSKYRAEFLKGI